MIEKAIYTLLYHGTQHSELSGEFSFPDYLPDVRRVLRVIATPHITGKYMNGERLELEGEIGMTLLYCSEESTVCTFGANLPFAQSIAIPGLDETAVITAKLNTDNTVCRLTGPRKCILRTKPSLHVRAAAKREIAPDLSSLPSAEAAKLCIDTEDVTASDLVCVSHTDLRYAEDLSVSDGVIVSVLSCEVSPVIRECRAMTGCAVCKGEFAITALCTVQEEDGIVCRTLNRRVPFSETLHDPAMTESHRCEPDLTVTAVTPTITEEGRNLGVDFVCELALLCSADIRIPVITDAFLPSYDIRRNTEPYTVFRPLKTVFGALSASGTIKFDAQDPPKTVTNVRMTAGFDRWEWKEGRIHFDGTLDISAIFTGDDGKYLPYSHTIPLHWDTDAAGLPDAASLLIQTECGITGQNTRIDSSAGTVVCDAELSVFVSVCAKETQEFPRALSLPPDAKAYPPIKEPLIFCYPEKGETVWDIAKRYRIPPMTICEANGMEITSKIAEISPLVIPIHPIFSKMKA